MASVSDLVYIDSTGYHYTTYPNFLAWLTAQYQAIYGADVYLTPDSQDGQFLAIVAQALYDTAALGGSVYNSFSPITGQGVGLSRNVKINGISRKIPTFSTVGLVCVGTAGTVISNGSATDSLDQQWNLPTTVTIPDAGTITVTATAEEIGAVQAAPNTITQIFTPTRGWQTVNNPSAATPGQPVETDPQLRVRQSHSVAEPSLTVLDGSIGAVANVEGVTTVRAYENDTGTTDANGIPGHTICMVVVGGDSVAIAQAIALHKTPGTGTFGNTSELVYDDHGMPLVINFSIPTIVTIHVRITLSVKAGWSSDYEDLIKQSVANFVNAIGIGNDVLITRVFDPAYLNGSLAGDTYDISLVELAKNGGSYGTSNISIDFDELASCDAETDVTIIIV